MSHGIQKPERGRILAGLLLAFYGVMQTSITAAVVGCIVCWVAGGFYRS